eukprot:CAMPEP_0174712188 /NCGR_PEP_ID=MMETSP1094-20130205/13275_1 /TAXON_ID=156173 /ORGANISM="Chrysochromulina brevifilum, Strain UTEX LB 985" /LENGTH=173 /DNA_ID=CAMNT_0015911231 /DNA_START=105 /DNA_END=624 /DNA_ORIENTATION=-
MTHVRSVRVDGAESGPVRRAGTLVLCTCTVCRPNGGRGAVDGPLRSFRSLTGALIAVCPTRHSASRQQGRGGQQVRRPPGGGVIRSAILHHLRAVQRPEAVVALEARIEVGRHLRMRAAHRLGDVTMGEGAEASSGEGEEDEGLWPEQSMHGREGDGDHPIGHPVEADAQGHH